MVEPANADVTVADVLVDYLERIGVKHVFGVPGGAIEPIYNALARAGRRGAIEAVIARHETGAAFMADGYARETGKLGVVLATSGPGTTNLITGVASAYANDIPLLVITGQPPLDTFGKNALQESSCTGINTVSMLRHCTHYNSLVSHADQFEMKLVSAIMQTGQMPSGPSHLSIPVDIQRSTVKTLKIHSHNAALLQAKPSSIDIPAVKELEALLKQASTPVFLIGNGCGEAAEAIMTLVQLTGGLFITTPDGKGYIDPHHHAYRGVYGLGGHESANALLSNAPDLVIALGTGMGEFSSAGWNENLLNSRLVHVDSSKENLMRTPMARLHVRGRVLSICHHLIECFTADTDRGNRKLAQPDSGRTNTAVAVQAPEQFHSAAIPIKPQRLMKELSMRFPSNTRFLADAGNSMIWATHYLQPAKISASNMSSWLRVTMEFASMGWAIGASVGVARGNPGCPVVCITGDGSYLMSGQEITVAILERLTVIFVVLNDSAYGMVMHGQRIAGAEPIGYKLPDIDYRLMAQAMCIPGHVIDSVQAFEAIDFAAIVARQGPTMLDVRIDGDEVPPMLQRLKTLGSLQKERT